MITCSDVNLREMKLPRMCIYHCKEKYVFNLLSWNQYTSTLKDNKTIIHLLFCVENVLLINTIICVVDKYRY